MFKASLSLGQKATILIAVPLLSGVLSVLVLMGIFHQYEQKSKKIELYHDILESAQSFAEDMVVAARSTVEYLLLRRKDSLASIDESISRVKEDLALLARKLPRDEKTLSKLNELNRLSDLCLATMREARRQGEVGDTEMALETLKTARSAIARAAALGTQITNPYRKLGSLSTSFGDDFRRALKLTILAWLLASILLTLAMSVIFNRSITRRLETLMDNALRLNENQSLNPPVGGQDEIAQLDLVFHRVADSLTEAANHLRASEAKIRAIIEGMPVGITVLDDAGRIVSVNPKTAELLGSPQNSISGAFFPEMLAALDDPSIRYGLADLQESCSEAPREFVLLRKDGSVCAVDVSLRTLQGVEGASTIVGMQDVTERRKVETLKRDFVAMISHDLRAPLTSIKLTLEMLSSGYFGQLPEPAVRKLTNQEENCQQVLRLLNQLLGIERLEAGRLDLSLEVVSVSELFEATTAAMSAMADNASISLSWDNTDIHFIGDKDRLLQVLINLVSNALKFSGQHTTVNMSSEALDNFIEIRVTDRGRGIPSSQLSSIFERYHQVADTDSRKNDGVGLGLAICKAIVDAHGGSIGVDSQVGIGSTFWFRIPVRQTSQIHSEVTESTSDGYDASAQA